MIREKQIGIFNSTVINFIMVLIVALLVSSLLFTGMSAISDSLISGYVRDNDLVEKEISRMENSLRLFVNKYTITTKNVEKLADWSRSEKYAHLIVFQQNEIVFDSDIMSEMALEKRTVFAPNNLLQLSDNTVPIFLDSFHEYRYYEIAVFVELVISFLLFTVIMVFFVAQHLKYLKQIVFGVEVLEGGNLEYEIPVRGNDELALLASSLNEMRKVLIRKNDKATDNSERGFVDLAVISHDLRTPLTTLMLFIEIIKTKKNVSDSERDYYIQKIAVIASKIKMLTENLEDFTSDEGQYSVALDSPRPVEEILQELLPDAILFLKERGFNVVRKSDMKKECITVNSHFTYRIIDNIVSNIDRYAAHEHAIIVSTSREGAMASISFINTISKSIPPLHSSKLGLTLVKKMMQKMNGTCTVSRQIDRFIVILRFPIVSEKALQ